jgi:hypothetical protein
LARHESANLSANSVIVCVSFDGISQGELSARHIKGAGSAERNYLAVAKTHLLAPQSLPKCERDETSLGPNAIAGGTSAIAAAMAR